MTNVDKWQNSLEEVEQAQQQEQQELWQELKEREPFEDTAARHRYRKTVALKDISRKGNIRPDLPDVIDLASSIKERGLIQSPLLAENQEGELSLVAGFRRIEALSSLYGEEHQIECDVVKDLGETERIALMLVENEQRKDIEPIITARTLRDLMRKNEQTSASALARSLGLSSRWVQDRLRLLDLPTKVQERISKGDLSFTVADLIRRKVEDGTIVPEQGEELSHKVADGDLKAGELREMFEDAEEIEETFDETEDRPAIDLGFEVGDFSKEFSPQKKEKTEEEELEERSQMLEDQADNMLQHYEKSTPETVVEEIPFGETQESRISAGECIALAHCLMIYPDFAHKHGIENPWTEVPVMSKKQRDELFASLQSSVWINMSEEFKQHFVFGN